MSYNYSDYQRKNKEVKSFNPQIPPEDNKIPSGLIKDLQRTGAEEVIYEYKSAKKETCFWIKRKENKGKKEFTPMSYDPEKKTWVPKAWPKDRPVFREDRISGNDKPILIAEGEKSVLKAEKEFPEFVSICWSGGSNQVHQTNFKNLIDREVILWPDNDKAGIEAMTEVALNLLDNSITTKIKFIKPLIDLPKGWDIADPIPTEIKEKGITLQGMLNTADEFNPEQDKKLVNKIKKKWEEKEQKAQLNNICDQYIYVRSLDEWFETSTRELVKSSKLDNWLAHIFKDQYGRGNLSKRLLANPATKKVLGYIKLATKPPGLINATEKDNPLITPGPYLNLYQQNSFDLIKGDIKPFIDFYTDFLGGSEQFQHLDRYLAGYFQLRGQKLKNSPVIVSPEGGGKGILADEFLAPGIGFKNVATNVSYQNVISKHSTIVRDFSLVVINEVVILKQHSEKVEISNALKSLITDPFIVIDEKNKPIINILNTTNFIIYSNKRACLNLDNSSRRYCILYSNKTKEQFEQMDKDGVFERFIDWARKGGAQFVAHYYTKERELTKEDKKYLFGRAPKTDGLKELIETSKHPTIKKLDDRFKDEAEPFTKEWVGFISKNQLITWIEANFKGHAPDQEIEDWLKEKAIPWKDGNLTRRIQTENEGRPRVYLLIDRPEKAGEGSYLDWGEGELGYAPTTGTIALSNNAGPMKWNADNLAKDGAQRAMSLASQMANTSLDIVEMVYQFKKAQNKALNRINKIEKSPGGEEFMKKEIPTGETTQEGDKVKSIYATRKNHIISKIQEKFIKEFASIFIHERGEPWTNKGPHNLGKRRPPNVKAQINWEKDHLELELINYRGNKEEFVL